MEETTETEALSFWDKTSEDITIKDTVVLTTGIMVVSVAAPFIVMGVWAGVTKISDAISRKRRDRKDLKQLEKAVDESVV